MEQEKLTERSWDDPDEARNPKNWGMAKKLIHTAIPCLGAFIITFATSVMVPATPSLMLYFNISRTVSLLPLTLYTLGLAFGPLFVAPLSEIYGRRYVLIGSLAALLAFTGGSGAATNFATLLVCRFLAGFLGSAGVATGAGTIADVWAMGKARGPASLCFILGPFLGPAMGPLVAAFVLNDLNEDWRWTMWITVILGAPIWIGTILMKETSRVILIPKYFPVESPVEADLVSTATKIFTSIKRPTRMLFTEVIVFSLSLYTAFAYATIFSFFASASYVLEVTYGFDRRQVGLSFISVIIGYILAAITFVGFDKTLYAKAAAAGKGHAAPEHRLYAALAGSIFLPAGLFWYAWEPHHGGNWAALVASGIFIGFGALALFVSSITYMVDVYQAQLAASAIAANGSIRFLLGAVFPLFTFQMYQELGIHWAGSIFAFISVALMPIPWIMFQYGPRLREASPLAPTPEKV